MYHQFSNLYVNYYHGSYIKLNDRWEQRNAICPFSKIYYIMHGECEIKIADRVYHALPGDFFLIPAGTRHSFYHINDNFVKKYWFHFDIEAGTNNLFDLIKMPCYHHFGTNRRIISLFKSILKLSLEPDFNSQLLLNSRIIELVSLFFDATGASYTSDEIAENNIIETIVRYINANPNKNITIEELAEMAHFHPNYFVRFFKERMGIPPAKYIISIKIELAKSMLQNTSIPVKNIMNAIGISDYSQFSKFFKRYSGYSPKTFRSLFSNL